MVLYYSFGLIVAFNQWREETKQTKTCSFFQEGIIAAVLNVGNDFKFFWGGAGVVDNTFLRVAENLEISQKQQRNLGLWKLKKKKKSRDSKTLEILV